MNDFCQKLQTVLRQNTGYQHTSVRSIGCTLYITLQADPGIILETVFAPFLQYQPRWEVKSHGWHHIFFTHQGTNTLQYNYNGKRDKRLAKTHRGKSYKQAEG